MLDLVEYLETKDVPLQFTSAGSEAYTQCFFCDESPSKHGRLYFNIEEDTDKYGLYNCFLCNEHGNFHTLLQHFGDDTDQLGPTPITSVQRRIFAEATQYYALRLLQNVEAYEYLQYQRGLTDDTIERAALGWADGGLLRHLMASGFELEDIRESGLINRFGNDFLDQQITIPYQELGQTISIRGKEIGGKYLSLPGSTAHLYGVDAVRGERDIIVTAGEFDSLLLQQMGYSAVGVPGENIWKPEWESHIEDAGRIFILFDNDRAGHAGAEKLAHKLGPSSRLASFPDSRKKIDVTEWVVNQGKTKDDFDMLLIKAKGGMLVSVLDAEEKWLQVEGNPDLVGHRFNIEELDSRMQFSLLPSQVMTVVARTNSGKTILTINLLRRMLDLDPSLKILYVSLEQTRNEWFERAYRIENFYNPGATTLDTINFWKDSFYLVDKNRLSREELEVCVDQYAFEAGGYPDIVAVDYLGYYARSYSGEEYTRTTDAIMDMKAIAKERELSMIVPHQANRSGDFGKELSADMAKSSGAVEETSDLLMGLWAPDQMVGVEDHEQKRQLHLKIIKARDTGVNTKVIMQFAPLTLAVVPRSDALYPRAVRELQYAIAGDDWKTAVYRHRTGDESVDLAY